MKWKELKVRAEQQVKSLGLSELDVFSPVSELAVAQQQIVEICKALRRQSRVIVFDEPTAVLTDRETARLFELIGASSARASVSSISPTGSRRSSKSATTRRC